MSRFLLSKMNPFSHRECYDSIADLIKERDGLIREVQDLKSQLVRLMTELQESKDIYDYQTAELEKKIAGNDKVLLVKDRTIEDLHSKLRAERGESNHRTKVFVSKDKPTHQANNGQSCYDLAEELKARNKLQSKRDNVKNAKKRLGRPKGSLGQKKKNAAPKTGPYFTEFDMNLFNKR